MKHIKSQHIIGIFLLFSTIVIYGQNTPRELESLVGMKAAYLDDNLADKGYKFIKNEKSSNNSYSYYWNRNKGKCITTRTNNGRVASIVSTPSEDCDKGGNNHSSNHGTFDFEELKGMKSKAAYASLEQHGFANTKTFQEDDVTYKLWYNSKKDQCIKTYSKNYYIARIENSNNCK